MEIVREIPKQLILRYWIESGLQIAGGFPLYLVGGSQGYSDIDLYANLQRQYDGAKDFLDKWGMWAYATEYTEMYYTGAGMVQLVKPGARPFSDTELLNMADMSPSACLLTLMGGEFVVRALYPDDIRNRVCRVLIEHEWTWYRKEQYIKKGYTIDG